MPESAMKSRAALVEDVGDVLEVLRRLLDADDVRVRAPQAADGRRRDVDGGADRHVVDEQRQVRELARDTGVPVVQPLLLRPAVVRRHDERAGGAEALGLGGQLERLVHERAAGAGQERAAAVDRARPRRA